MNDIETLNIESKVIDVKRRLSDISIFAIDMDGTIYLGKNLFPFTKTFLDGLQNAGKDFVFLTNNSSRNANDYFLKLRKMGLEIEKTRIYTSGDATIEYLQALAPGARIFLMGTNNLQDDFANAGFILTDIDPDFVVLGYDLGFNYKKLDKACQFIRQGVTFIATHPDLNCPLEDGKMAPDCGSLTAAIVASTGISPKVIGKPHHEMLNGLLSRTHVKKENLCIIGDRLSTDIKMGMDFGVLNVLVLTGEAKIEDLKTSSFTPDLVVKKTVDLMQYL